MTCSVPRVSSAFAVLSIIVLQCSMLLPAVPMAARAYERHGNALWNDQPLLTYTSVPTVRFPQM